MKSLVEQLNSKDSISSLRYRGPNDIATSLEIKFILKNIDFIKDYLIKNPLVLIKNIEQFMDYFYNKKIMDLDAIVPLLQSEENKEILTEIITIVKDINDKIKIGQIICFINEHIKDIFSEEYQIYDLSDVTLEVIIQCQNGIKKEVFGYLIDNHDYLMIDNYSNFQKLLEKDIQLFSRLFKIETIEKLLTYRNEEVFSIFVNIFGKENSKLLDIIRPLVDKIIMETENKVKNMTIDNVMLEIHEFKQVYNFLKRIKHPTANIFFDYDKRVEELLDGYLEVNGQDISYKIPVGQIIEEMKSFSHWEEKMLYITHSKKKIEEKISYISRLAEASKGRQGLIDYASTNIPVDDYFTLSHQRNLEYRFTFGAGIIIGIWNDEELYFEIIAWYEGVINYIAGKINSMGDNLIGDFYMLSTMLQPVIKRESLKDKEVLSSICYGPAIFICTLTEKILRLVYIDLLKDKTYIPVSNATLGQLLNINNQEFVKIFGVDYLKNINYFFCSEEKKKIGKNYRNSLAHWSGMSKEMLNDTFVAGLMYLYTDVLNSLFWFFLREEVMKEED